MNKYNFMIIGVAALCLTATSCRNKKEKTREDRVAEFRAELTRNDTTEMLKLADDAMELLKGKKIDEVIGSLYEYNDSTEEVKPLSKEMVKRLQRRFKIYPVQSYEREYYSFMLEGCNDVKYKVTFATAEQTGTDQPATTMFMFNPVRVDGQWKLCVKTPSDEVDEEHL